MPPAKNKVNHFYKNFQIKICLIYFECVFLNDFNIFHLYLTVLPRAFIVQNGSWGTINVVQNCIVIRITLAVKKEVTFAAIRESKTIRGFFFF